jgi:ABC-type transport system involved in cytochrome c biogenesis permease component
MNHFLMIVLHYLKRASRDIKEIVLLLLIPSGLIVFQSVIDGEVEGIYLNGYNVLVSHIAPAMILSFQFFNGFFMFSFLYSDFRGAMRWRLLASPCPVRTFVFPAFIANWLISLALGVVYIVVTALFFNVYWSNFFVVAGVLVIISLMATFVATLIFLFTKRLAQANTIGYIVSFGLMVLSGFMIPLQLFGDNVVVRFLINHGTPLSLGTSAVVNSGGLDGIFDGMDVIFAGVGDGGGMTRSLTNIGILAAITVVFGLIAVITARRRKF